MSKDLEQAKAEWAEVTVEPTGPDDVEEWNTPLDYLKRDPTADVRCKSFAQMEREGWTREQDGAWASPVTRMAWTITADGPMLKVQTGLEGGSKMPSELEGSP